MTPEQFIRKYRTASIVNGVFRSVPPSITLAQAAVESGWGTSAIAQQANNLFGIRPGPAWKGPIIDTGTNYTFRAYDSPLASFRDHARFLHKNSRYEGLFMLPFTDYTAWAWGLVDAGYTTGNQYPVLLIDVIETHNLQKYDKLAIAIRYLIIILIFVLFAIIGRWIFQKYIQK